VPSDDDDDDDDDDEYYESEVYIILTQSISKSPIDMPVQPQREGKCNHNLS
jgi:hypothetical protein